MGYYIYIKLSKPITEQSLGEIIDKLPSSLKHGPGKQSWGWSISCDVKLRDEQTVTVSGSYGMSGKNKDWLTETLARRLEHAGYQLTIEGDIDT